MLGNADNIAISSPAYRQLQQDLLVQKERANIQERELAACKRIRYQQAEKLKEFQKLIDEQNTKNPRNAGRKPKLTEGQIQEIKEMRKKWYVCEGYCGSFQVLYRPSVQSFFRMLIN